MAQYSGYPRDNECCWNFQDCALVEEFIKDKQFDMYEDIEELPECCKKIAEIEQMFQDNLVNNDDKQKIKDRIWPILDTKLNSLSEQLKKIKIKETKDDNVSKAINDFIEKQQQPNKYQRLLDKAEKVIKAMKNDSADNGLDEVDEYKYSKSEDKNKSK